MVSFAPVTSSLNFILFSSFLLMMLSWVTFVASLIFFSHSLLYTPKRPGICCTTFLRSSFFLVDRGLPFASEFEFEFEFVISIFVGFFAAIFSFISFFTWSTNGSAFTSLSRFTITSKLFTVNLLITFLKF